MTTLLTQCEALSLLPPRWTHLAAVDLWDAVADLAYGHHRDGGNWPLQEGELADHVTELTAELLAAHGS